jgi:RNA polymerase sigma-70 factor (ECF subfamily)
MQTTSSPQSTRHFSIAKQQQSDEYLLASVADGSSAALETLFSRHQAVVYRFVLRLTKNPSIAEEAVNEVFLDVWRGAGKFEGRCKVSTWLLAIARHKALAAFRNGKESQLDECAASTIEDSADNPEVSLVKQECGTLVRHCLDQLSAAQRQIIELYYMRGRSVPEVATLVGIPAGTVKTRMFYARNRMAALLEQAGIDSNRV